MSKRLQRLLSCLCVLSLLLGCVPMLGSAEEAGASVVTLTWDDQSNQDGIRPDKVKAVLYGNAAKRAEVELNEENNWTMIVAVPRTSGGAAVQYTWDLETPPAGYTVKVSESKDKNGDVTALITAVHAPETLAVSVRVEWSGDDASVRPSAVYAQLLADGMPWGGAAALTADGWSKTWRDLPKYRSQNGTAKEVVYTVEQPAAPAGYAGRVNGNQRDGFVITNTLELGKLVVIANLEGADGADVSNLRFVISGPDARMPLTLSYSDFSGHRYEIDRLMAGAYLVQEEGADSVADRILDTWQSTTVGTAKVTANAAATVELKNRYVKNEDELNRGDVDHVADPSDLSKLTFRIDGPDPRMPMTVTYAEFTGGKYTLDNLESGVYTVAELNAGTLIAGYTLNLDKSNQGAAVQVAGGAVISAVLKNVYQAVKATEIPTPEPTEIPTDTPAPIVTPTPEATPEPTEGPTDEPTPEPTEEPTPEPTQEPTPEPTPEVPEIISIPVVKNWIDNDDHDGNRPQSVVVRLFADGAEIGSTVLTKEGGWSYVFENLPKTQAGREIAYTVTEDAVPLYDTLINGYNITNVYHPEVTSVSVRKVWDDNDNLLGLRPVSIYVALNNGMAVVLSENNNWTATINNLPTVLNGQPAVYTWHEQEVLGYQQTSVETIDGVTVFTNSFHKRPTPPDGPKTPPSPGTPILIIEDYDTPLGIDVIINHVGDCFD